jgi:hypothetical protein
MIRIIYNNKVIDTIDKLDIGLIHGILLNTNLIYPFYYMKENDKKTEIIIENYEIIKYILDNYNDGIIDKNEIMTHIMSNEKLKEEYTKYKNEFDILFYDPIISKESIIDILKQNNQLKINKLYNFKNNTFIEYYIYEKVFYLYEGEKCY